MENLKKEGVFFNLTSILIILIILLSLHVTTRAQTQKQTVKKEKSNKDEKLQLKETSKDEKIILIKTSKGNIRIKLFTKEAPITTENFIDLVERGFYNGTVFHRVVADFVIQGGDPLGDGTGNYIDPETGKPRLIKLENSGLKFDRAGRVGMARTSNPNSASCQFFIALQPLPSLDPGGVDPYGYAVFGQVIDDTFNTVRKIVEDFKPALTGSDRPSSPVRMISVTLE